VIRNSVVRNNFVIKLPLLDSVMTGHIKVIKLMKLKSAVSFKQNIIEEVIKLLEVDVPLNSNPEREMRAFRESVKMLASPLMSGKEQMRGECRRKKISHPSFRCQINA
jgi:hypothetical protein